MPWDYENPAWPGTPRELELRALGDDDWIAEVTEQRWGRD